LNYVEVGAEIDQVDAILAVGGNHRCLRPPTRRRIRFIAAPGDGHATEVIGLRGRWRKYPARIKLPWTMLLEARLPSMENGRSVHSGTNIAGGCSWAAMRFPGMLLMPTPEKGLCPKGYSADIGANQVSLNDCVSWAPAPLMYTPACRLPEITFRAPDCWPPIRAVGRAADGDSHRQNSAIKRPLASVADEVYPWTDVTDGLASQQKDAAGSVSRMTLPVRRLPRRRYWRASR